MEQKKSSMQIAWTRIKSFSLKNDFVNIPEDCERSLEIHYNVGDIVPVVNTEKYVTTGTISLTIVNKKDDESLQIEAVSEAGFLFEGTDKNEFEQLANLNGQAMLYSVLRGQIMSMSAQCLYGTSLVLPVLNFTSNSNKNTEKSK